MQVLIADEGIVEVVEGRHAEDALVEATQAEVVLSQGLVAGDEGGGPYALLGGLSILSLCPVVDVGMQEAGLRLEASVRVVRRHRSQQGEACGIGKVTKVCREGIVLRIRSERHAPVPAERELMGSGEVAFVLVVVVVDVHRRHIQTRVGEVVQVVVGILRIG